ncbi:MAG TPA: hypothetical protein VJS15_07585, partial [Allosphingosinicella sp.]|nr:hypothetical protein [Allosphingosinicella sp.]
TLLGSAVVAQQEGPPPVYCREPGATARHGVYRVEGSRDSYLLALGDAGVALSLGQALDLGALTGQGGGGRRYSMTLLERSATSALPSFNRLPPPDQAIAVAFGNRGPVISISTEDRPER